MRFVQQKFRNIFTLETLSAACPSKARQQQKANKPRADLVSIQTKKETSTPAFKICHGQAYSRPRGWRGLTRSHPENPSITTAIWY